MPVCGFDVCLNGGWIEDNHDRPKPEEKSGKSKGKGEL
jgi:hypothetical protein